MRRPRSPRTTEFVPIFIGVLFALSACSAPDAADQPDEVPGEAEIVDAPQGSAPGASPAGEVLVFDLDRSALPEGRLTMEAFVEDACAFATAEQVSAFLGLDLTPATAESEPGMLYGSECHYGLGEEEVMVDIRFNQLASGRRTEEIGLAGAAGVLRTVTPSTLENSARIQIPMTLERTAANALEIVIRSRYRGLEADRESLTAAVDALATNLIDRLMLVP